MTKFWSYVGGLAAGLAISATTFTGTFLSDLGPFFDVVSLLVVLVFAGGLVWEGVKSMFRD